VIVASGPIKSLFLGPDSLYNCKCCGEIDASRIPITVDRVDLAPLREKGLDLCLGPYSRVEVADQTITDSEP